MWWFLVVPVVSAVVAAVANHKEKEACEHQARIQSLKAGAQTIAHFKQANLEKRKAQLIADTGDQLRDLFAAHPAVLDRTAQGPLHVNFNSIRAFATKRVPIKPDAMLKHLETVASGAAFSPIWMEHAAQAHALQKKVMGLQRLKEEL